MLAPWPWLAFKRIAWPWPYPRQRLQSCLLAQPRFCADPSQQGYPEKRRHIFHWSAEQKAEKKFLERKKDIVIQDKGLLIKAIPYNGFRLSFMVDFQGFGEQRLELEINPDTYLKEIAPARTFGYKKELELHGVGYRAKMQGKNLVLSVGFSHPVVVEPKDGIEFEVDKNNKKIKVVGIDKQKVGQSAAEIRKIRPPEPYKGKGIRYKGEEVKKKPGKAAKTVGIGEG